MVKLSKWQFKMQSTAAVQIVVYNTDVTQKIDLKYKTNFCK